MTDSPNDRRDEHEEVSEGSTLDVHVPRDVGWQLVSQAHYDPAETDGLTITIVAAVAEAEGVPPTAILDPPLYDSVDTVELESTLFGTNSGEGVSPDAGSVEFVYRDYRIVVQRDGWVLVHEPEER